MQFYNKAKNKMRIQHGIVDVELKLEERNTQQHRKLQTKKTIEKSEWG